MNALTQHKLTLRILGTSDLHGHLVAFDYASDTTSDLVGLSRTASLIRAARAERPNSLLFDCGDLLQGTVLADLAQITFASDKDAITLAESQTHPMTAALNLIGYDAATLGNHDFDYGIDFAHQAYSACAFPIVVSNLVPQPPNHFHVIQRSALLERDFLDTAGNIVRLRIGVVGLLPPQTTEWDRDKIDGRFFVLDMAESAKRAAADLREAGADFVVALAHTGFPRPDNSDAAENAALALAQTDSIDALLLGHAHRAFPGPGTSALPGVDARQGTIYGKPAAMPGMFGSHLAVIDLLLSGHPGSWMLDGFEVRARPIAQRLAYRKTRATVEDDGAVLKMGMPFHMAARAHGDSQIGRSRRDLHTYFALVHDSAALNLLASAQEWWAATRLAGTPFADLPAISMVSPLKSGGRAGPAQYSDVPAGELRVRHIDDLYPFNNMFCAATATGADVRDYLDSAAAVFNTIVVGGHDQPLFDEDTPSYLFDVLYGLTYTVDVTRPPRNPKFDPPSRTRIADLSYNGRPVTPEDRFTILSNSHRLSGPEFHNPPAGRIVFRSRDPSRDVLRKFIGNFAQIPTTDRPTWTFVPAGGTRVLFPSGPGAVRYLGTSDAPETTVAGYSPEGFVRFRMSI